MPDVASLLVIAGTFLIAETVKGVIDLGLPSVSLDFLAVAIDLRTATALTSLPVRQK